MLSKAKFLAKEAKLRLTYMTTKDCIFCKIVARKIKSNIIYQNDKVLAFPDINPVSDVHILIVPKRHIDSVLTIDSGDSEDLVAMYGAVAKLVDDKKLDAFRVAFNGGKFQHVPHLHMHLLAGSKIEWRKL